MLGHLLQPIFLYLSYRCRQSETTFSHHCYVTDSAGRARRGIGGPNVHRDRAQVVDGEEGGRDSGGRAGSGGGEGNPRGTDQDEEELLRPRQRPAEQQQVGFLFRGFPALKLITFTSKFFQVVLL